MSRDWEKAHYGHDVHPAAPGIDLPTPRNREEAMALAKLALAYLGVVDAHIDAAILRCETDASPKGGHPAGTPTMPGGMFYDGCWERLPKGMQQHGRMLTQSWRVADSTELKRALEAGVLAMMGSPKGGSDAARLDWLESEIRHYGDGQTEPREAYIGFNWQQGDGVKVFPGLRAAIDAEMQATSAEVGP